MDQSKRRHEHIVRRMTLAAVVLVDIVVDPTKSIMWENIPIRTIVEVVGKLPQPMNSWNVCQTSRRQCTGNTRS
jgi:hypothetical protein